MNNSSTIVNQNSFFWRLHFMATTACFMSTTCSIYVLILNFYPKKIRNGQRVCQSMRSRRLIERLVIYLAISDLLFSAIHGSDHLYLLINVETAETSLCRFFAFFMHWGLQAQCSASAFVAIAGFLSIIFSKKIRFGLFDFILVSVSFLLPGAWSTLGLMNGWFGSSGAWCGIDRGHPSYLLLLIIYTGIYPWIDLLISCVTYISIIGKLIESRARLRMANANATNEDTVKIQIVRFMIFITLLIIQWTPLSLFLLMSLFGTDPPPYLTFTTVVFTNLGGVFNGLAYSAFHTIKKKILNSRNRSRTNSSATWSLQKSA